MIIIVSFLKKCSRHGNPSTMIRNGVKAKEGAEWSADQQNEYLEGEISCRQPKWVIDCLFLKKATNKNKILNLVQFSE